jgi:hypothetical protein
MTSNCSKGKGLKIDSGNELHLTEPSENNNKHPEFVDRRSVILLTFYVK